MNNVFIIVLLVILVIFYAYGFTERFENTGVFNHFYGKYMNPYKYPMNTFFSNDKTGTINYSK